MSSKTSSSDALHLLRRITFGPKPGLIAEVQGKGTTAFIEEQLVPRPDPTLSNVLSGFKSLGYSVKQMLDIYHGRAAYGRGMPAVVEEFQSAKIIRAVHGVNQLREVLVDFWFNHFNVNLQHQFVRQSVVAYERDAIRPFVLGRFEDMLRATARHPAMLFYLDNHLSKQNTVVDGKLVRGLNENYGRELLELHTLGVAAGYSQDDVVNATRCFTGWTIDDLKTSGKFQFRAADHDPGEKTVFGLEIAAHGGEGDGERLLAYLANHPATARFIARKLATRFIADAPPDSAVDRIAKTFLATRGDLRAVTREVITCPEFWDSRSTPKFRSPFEFVAASLRAAEAEVRSAEPGLTWHFDNMGMRPYFCTPPTGWSDRGRDWQSSAHIYRLNFALDLGHSTIEGIRTTLPERLAKASASTATASRLAALLNREVFGGELSARTMAILKSVPNSSVTAARVIGLTLASPEMQWR